MMPSSSGPPAEPPGQPELRKEPLEPAGTEEKLGPTSLGSSSKTSGKIIPIVMTPPSSSSSGPSGQESKKESEGQGSGKKSSSGSRTKIIPIKMTPPQLEKSGHRDRERGRKRKPSRFSSGPADGLGLDKPLPLLCNSNSRSSGGRIIKLASKKTPKVKMEVDDDDDYGLGLHNHNGNGGIALEPVVIKIENDQANHHHLHHHGHGEIGKWYKRTLDGEIKMSSNGNPALSSDGSLGSSASCSSSSTSLGSGSAIDSKSPLVQVRFSRQRPAKYNKVDHRKKILTNFPQVTIKSNSKIIKAHHGPTDLPTGNNGGRTRKNKNSYVNFRNFNVTPWSFNKLRKDKDRLLRKNALLREEYNEQKLVVANLIDKLGECENDNEKILKLFEQKEAELQKEKERYRNAQRKFQRELRDDKTNIYEHYKSEISKVSDVYEKTMISFIKDLTFSRALPINNGSGSIALNTDHPAFYYLRGYRDYQKKEQFNHSFVSTPPVSYPSILPPPPAPSSAPLPMAFNLNHNARPTHPSPSPSPISVIVGVGANRLTIGGSSSSILNSNSNTMRMDVASASEETIMTNSTISVNSIAVPVLNNRPSTSKEANNEGDNSDVTMPMEDQQSVV